VRLLHPCIGRSRFRIKGRERSPANLHSALRIALRLRNDLYCVEWGVKLYSLLLLQLEGGTKDVDQIRNEQPKHFARKAREITRTESLVKTTEELRKYVSELQNQLAKVTLRLNAYNSVRRHATERHVAETSRPNMKPRPKDFA